MHNTYFPLLFRLTLALCLLGFANARAQDKFAGIARLQSIVYEQGAAISTTRRGGNTVAIDIVGNGQPLHISELTDLTSLRRIRLSRVALSNVTIRNIAAVDSLVNLQLDNCRFLDQSTLDCRDLGNLQSLTILHTDCSLAFDDGLAQAVELREVDLTASTIADGLLKGLSKARRLNRLCLASTNVSPSGVSFLQFHPSLAFLDLSKTAIDLNTLARIATIPRLRHLALKYCARLNGDALAVLAHCAALQSLEIRGLSLTGLDAYSPVALPKLRFLDCTDCVLDKTSLLPLVQGADLQVITLDGTTIECDELVLALKRMSDIDIVSLNHCSLDCSAITQLAAQTTARTIICSDDILTLSEAEDIQSRTGTKIIVTSCFPRPSRKLDP